MPWGRKVLEEEKRLEGLEEGPPFRCSPMARRRRLTAGEEEGRGTVEAWRDGGGSKGVEEGN